MEAVLDINNIIVFLSGTKGSGSKALAACKTFSEIFLNLLGNESPNSRNQKSKAQAIGYNSGSKVIPFRQLQS